MNIHDEIWDKIVSECLELVDYIESFPKEVLIPGKHATLSMAYSIINLENSVSEIDEILGAIGRLEKIIKCTKKNISKIKLKS